MTGSGDGLTKRELRGIGAGLLFHLLPSSARKKIGSHLVKAERERLDAGFDRYRALSRPARVGMERWLLGQFRRPVWPVYLFGIGLVAFVAVFSIHTAMFPQLLFFRRAELFSPLMSGLFSFLFLLLLAPHRLRILFRLPLRFEEWGLTLLVFIGLIWIIASIRLEETLFTLRIDRFSTVILFTGVVTAPLLEEIFFREMLPSVFGPPDSLIPGHLISALLFGLAHLPTGGTMALLYGMAALLLSTLRINTGRLSFPYLAHAAANGVTLFL